MKFTVAALAGIATLGSAAQAVDLRPGTEIVVAPADEISSRDVKAGDLFGVVVTNDVVQDGAIVIPRGTPGHARVAWKTGKSIYGKSGKVEVEMVDLTTAGGTVPIAGRYRFEGRGETGVTIAVTIIGGLAAGAVVVGHDAVAHPGVRWAARTVAPVAIGGTAPRMAAASGGVRLAGLVAADPYRAGRDAGLAARAAEQIDE